MHRYKLCIEYDGASFAGFQRQAHLITVQEALERAAYALSGQPTTFYGAGRTDAGVHATGQVVHATFDHAVPLDALRRGINFYLRKKKWDVVVREVAAVPLTFHARFSALFRRYEYTILNRPSPPVLERGRVWWLHGPLDVGAMQEAASLLCGTHDFQAFRAQECQSTLTRRTLDCFDLEKRGDHVVATIQAKAFLHNQVRRMMGTLHKIGVGVWPPSRIPEIFAGRAPSGPTAPPQGLCLVDVGYPP